MRSLLLLLIALSTAVAQPAFARNTTLNLPLADVIAMGQETGKLDGSVKFYLAGQATPPIKKTFGSDMSNKKTNGFNKGDEEACRWAALSALISFQGSAKRHGANAVTNMTSYYQQNETRDSKTYECHAGTFVVGVTLKGQYASVKR